jgi:hypothetical protein
MGVLHNDITKNIIIICYFLLCIAYTIRGEINLIMFKIQFPHHFMQFLVSIIYFTIAYTYLMDSKYNEKHYAYLWENPRFVRILIGYGAMVVLLSAFYILFKRNPSIIA